MVKKEDVKKHWESETCGTRYGSSASKEEWLKEVEESRYALEPHVIEFAEFSKGKNKRVLEIGVGAGVDFSHWVKNGAIATGIDLTQAAIKLTSERLSRLTLHPTPYTLLQSDAENLPFKDNSFDIVYSWGVLHHTPDTVAAFREAYRVLKPGGTLKAMIYHVNSWTGFLLWIKNCLLRGKPFKSIKKAIFENLESPGTKAYTLKEAKEMLQQIGFKDLWLKTKLCAGDLLTIKPSNKYSGVVYRLAWKLYPRFLVRMLGDRFGLEMLITATK